MQEILVSRRTLTDNSYVFDVVIGNLSLPAITEADAFAIAERVVDAVNNHTTETAKIVTCY